jgi:hypothetical protein
MMGIESIGLNDTTGLRILGEVSGMDGYYDTTRDFELLNTMHRIGTGRIKLLAPNQKKCNTVLSGKWL